LLFDRAKLNKNLSNAARRIKMVSHKTETVMGMNLEIWR
jgi:hypothetical protein